MYTKDYKGFTINVERYDSEGDEEMLRWIVIRNSDDLFMHEGIDYASVFVKKNQKNAIVLQEFNHWKKRVKKFLKLPKEEQLPENF